MKRLSISFISFLVVLLLCSCEEKFDYPVSTVPFNGPANTSPYSELYQGILDDYVAQGMPGVSAAIYSAEDGWWTGCAGMARLEDLTLLNRSHVFNSASICKPYIAALTMRLVEVGLLGLDDPIKDYLPEDIVNGIENADLATVRQLLGHTSGIFNFDDNIKMYLDTFNDPLLHPSSKSLFENYVYGVKAYCEAGEEYHYSNTGYSLLGMIIEEVSGKSLGDYFEQEIIQPLGLTNTFYKSSDGYPDAIPNKVNSYFEEFPGQMQNCTDMQNMLTDIAMGHEGVIASPCEYAHFIRELMRGNIVDSSTLEIMLEEENQDWNLRYTALGIMHWDGSNDGYEKFGHTGNTLGSRTIMMYIPKDDVAIAVASNLGGVIEGDNTMRFSPMIGELLDVLLEREGE